MLQEHKNTEPRSRACFPSTPPETFIFPGGPSAPVAATVFVAGIVAKRLRPQQDLEGISNDLGSDRGSRKMLFNAPV